MWRKLDDFIFHAFRKKKKKKTAAVVFVGVNKRHGQKLKFMPMTGVHTLSERQRKYSAYCILWPCTPAAHTDSETSANSKTSRFLIITLSLAVDNYNFFHW